MTSEKQTVCPVIVGRSAHLRALDAHLNEAQAGRGTVVLLAGEAGIGKSRLVAEMRAHAAARAMAILDCRCFEPDRAHPYAPLRDLVRSQITGLSHSATHDLVSAVPEVVSLVPELARFLPIFGGPENQEGALFHFSAQAAALDDQHQLTRALVRLITRFASRPALLIVEDLHWSDDGSLDVLLHLARRLGSSPILLLLTYRSDELSDSLLHTLALLDRERMAVELPLPRLTPAEVDSMLRAIFDQPQPIQANFLNAIHALTDGNPFFVEEVIRSLIAAGDIFRAGARWERRAPEQLQIPRSVHDAVLRRTRYLRPEAGRVMRLAAVAGRYFNFAVLQALTGHNDDQLLDLVRELIAAQLVVEESADRFAFRHALTRQAIYAEMLGRERRALHRIVAETLERLHAGTPEVYLSDLSTHFVAAEAWEKALEYTERAGAHALGLFAPGAAVEHFTCALDAAVHLSITPSPRLYRERGRALALLGNFEAASQDYGAVLERARSDGDRRAEWQALIDLGGLWAGYDYARAGVYFEQALALAHALDLPEAIAESLAQLGIWHLNDERTDEAEQCLQSALTSFERAGDHRGIARAVDLLGTVSDIAGDIAQMRQRYERAAALFRDLGDRHGLSSTLTTMALHGGADIFATVVTPPGIAPDQMTAEAEEALSLARTIGWRAGEAYALLCQAVGAIWRGHYGEALTLARDGLAVAQEIDHREWMALGHVTHGLIFGDLLLWPQALEHLTQACTLARGSGSLYWQHTTLGYHADALVMHGDLDAAGGILSTVAADLAMRALGQRRFWVARARLALAQADLARALDIVDLLFASALHLTGPADIPLLALLRGQALAALDRHEEAEAALRAALRGAGDRGALPLVWRCYREIGRLYTAQGRSADAAEEFGAARAVVDELAATLPGDLRSEFLSQVSASIPVHRERLAPRQQPLLTARERDVAALVARGLSNRDIAQALFIGERTVETHVGNILGKLSFGSRAQIVAWAIESGLGRSPK